MSDSGGLREDLEGARGTEGVTGSLNMKEVGGACSFCALNAALLFNLGATVGAFTDATAILSLLLCPGTPSKVRTGPCLVYSSFVNALFLITGGGGA